MSNNSLGSINYSRRLRSWLAPALASTAVVGVAFASGLAIGPGANDTVSGALSIQSVSATWTSRIGGLLPFGFAFLAGMVAAVNPCGFMMLPTYLTIYVSDQSDDLEADAKSVVKRGFKAVLVSLAMGVGFVSLFGAAGILVSASKEAVADTLPWIGLSLGFAMAAMGAYVLGGGKLYTALGQRFAKRIGDPKSASMLSYSLFGVSYALASLSCTLPIFLSVVTSSFRNDGFAGGLAQFISYAGGMTFLIMMMTLAAALFKGLLSTYIRKLFPYLNGISGGMLIMVGAYLIFYWLTEGDLARNFNLG